MITACRILTSNRSLLSTRAETRSASWTLTSDRSVRIQTLPTSAGRRITDFGSNFQLSPLLAQIPATVAINVVHIEAGGTVGRHK
jgi:hypothetical protein